jgi:uncharacterized glyoxalase superfamily protein PhnB
MIDNRTMPAATVFPVLVYPDVAEAIDWLCTAFGFRERWRAGGHRAVLEFDGGAVMLGEPQPNHADGVDYLPPDPAHVSASVMVRVADADAHLATAVARGAKILAEPRDHPYGERQYSAADLAGHRWTFSQSIADLAPAEWGGVAA